MANRISIIGAGVMGEAFIAALIRSGVNAQSISVVVRRPERGEELRKKYGTPVVALRDAVAGSDVILLGVKPQGLAEVAVEIAPHLKAETLVISLLAGKTIEGISKQLDGHGPIARVMPNTPTLIGKGMAGYSLSSSVSASQSAFVKELLAATGKAIEIPEELQNALTGTSGSGPAYFFRFVEAMTEGAVAMGLSREDATALTIQTFIGSAALLETSGETPTRLRGKVTSLKGATAEAIAVFDQEGLNELVANAMAASARRAAELAE